MLSTSSARSWQEQNQKTAGASAGRSAVLGFENLASSSQLYVSITAAGSVSIDQLVLKIEHKLTYINEQKIMYSKD